MSMILISALFVLGPEGSTGEYPQWVAYLSALLTPAIAVTGLVIAVQQHSLAKARHRFELYPERVKIYRELMEMFGTVIRDGTIDLPGVLRVTGKTSELEFMYGDEIDKYLAEVHKKGVALALADRDLDASPTNEAREARLKTLEEGFQWFVDQPDRARALFAKYLKMD